MTAIAEDAAWDWVVTHLAPPRALSLAEGWFVNITAVVPRKWCSMPAMFLQSARPWLPFVLCKQRLITLATRLLMSGCNDRRAVAGMLRDPPGRRTHGRVALELVLCCSPNPFQAGGGARVLARPPDFAGTEATDDVLFAASP